VISVGGLSLGGSMKTPVVQALARAMVARGQSVSILGHGYRGLNTDPRLISDGTQLLETAASAGDEAFLLSQELRGCPVAVGRDKVAAGRLLEERFGKRIILVDSGFQHLRLFRDLDIVCVTERDLADRVVPAGLLRESSRALTRADLVFTDRRSEGPRIGALRAQRAADVFSLVRTDFAFSPVGAPENKAEPPARAYAFCGLGWPERFVKDLSARGSSVVGHRFFRDHHPYDARDLRDVAEAAVRSGAGAVVTTGKDAVRIQGWPGPLPLLVLTARLEIERLPEVLKRIDRAVLARIKAGH
jgi:tetraacyldisaccharide 4'-kinase